MTSWVYSPENELVQAVLGMAELTHTFGDLFRMVFTGMAESTHLCCTPCISHQVRTSKAVCIIKYEGNSTSRNRQVLSFCLYLFTFANVLLVSKVTRLSLESRDESEHPTELQLQGKGSGYRGKLKNWRHECN